MQVNRQTFLQQLKSVQPGLAMNDRMDQGGSFIFRDGKIITFNNDVMMFAPSGLPDMTGAVHAKELLALVAKLSTEYIDISFTGGEMGVKSGRSKSGIRFDDEVRINVADGIEGFDKAKQHAMPEGLLAALDTARFCASSNKSMPKLTAMFVDSGAVMAMDQYRAIIFDVPKAKKLPTFLIPAASITKLFDYKPTCIAVTDTWAFFRNESDIVYACRLIAPTTGGDQWGGRIFPDVLAYMTVEGEKFTLPKAALDVLDKAEVFSNTQLNMSDRYVTITIKPGRVTIRGEGIHGWYEESIPDKEYKGDALEFLAQTTFLRQILPLVQDAMLSKDVTRIVFTGENFKHVFVCAKSQQTEEPEAKE